jgi:hypothetical protein
MILEKGIMNRQELIKYLSKEEFVVGKLVSNNNLVISFKKPSNTELNRIVDLVDEIVFSSRQVRQTPFVPKRTPIVPPKAKKQFFSPVDEEVSLVSRAENRAKELFSKNEKIKEILNPERAGFFKADAEEFNRVLKDVFVKEHGPAGKDLFNVTEQVVSRWAENADDQLSAVLKDWMFKKGISSPTQHHSIFLDKNERLLSGFHDIVKAGTETIKGMLERRGVLSLQTNEAIDIMFSTLIGVSREILRRRYPSGKLKVYRGVREEFFEKRGLTRKAIIAKGGKLKADMNSLSSWSLNRLDAEDFTGGIPEFPGGVFEMEISIDDVFLSFEAAPTLVSEQEVIVLGKQRIMRLIPLSIRS